MKKNILLFTSEFPPLPGGIGNHAHNLALHLTKLEYSVTVLTNYRTKETIDELNFDHSLPFNVIRVKRTRMVLFTYLNRIYKAYKLRNDNKDSIVIASGKFSLWIVAILNLFRQNDNSFSIIHGSELFQGSFFSNKLTHFSLSIFKKNIAVSNFTKELILKVNDSLDVVVINNGFSALKSNPNQMIKNDKISIITVGNVTHRKGQQNVIKVLPDLMRKYPTIHYEIVGIPTEELSFSKLAKQLGVLDHISFHGAVSSENLLLLLQQSKVFFMLSDILENGDVEGFGIAILEANYLGIPAIGSNNSGITDAIKNGYSGFLVNPNSSEEIVNALDSILNDYNNFSEQAFEWSKQFLWKKVILKYEKILTT